jgi:hypothetical protein
MTPAELRAALDRLGYTQAAFAERIGWQEHSCYVADNADYPGIERVTIRSYCGRNAEDCRFYRLTDDPDQTFDTLNKARRAWRKFVKFIHIDEPRKWVEPK